MRTVSKASPALWLAVLFCSLSTTLWAQNIPITATKLAFTHPELAESFAAYELYEIDAQKLHALSQTDTRFQFNIQFEDGQNWPLQLDYHDLRAPHYREVAITERGYEVLPRRPNITYQGYYLNASHGPVRFTITPDYFVGMIQKGDQFYFLEPLQAMIPEAPSNSYVLYDAADVLSDPSLNCTFKAGEKHMLPPDEHDHEHRGFGPRTQRMPECVEVDLATGGDILMFNRYGSVMAVNDFILNVTNLMEPLWDDFNLSFLIVDQFVVTSAIGNPWTTSNDAFTILDDFAAWAGPNFAPHDVGQIWTANDIQGCGSGPGNFGLIGCARDIGDVCGDQRYNVCEDFDNSTNCLRALSAHEIGHLFDGVHGQANNSTIMFGNIVCGATTWTAGNVTRIQNHIDSRDCLSGCGPCNISVMVDVVGETCPGDADGFINASVSGNQGLVTYVLSGGANDMNTTGMFGPLSPGNYTVTAQDDGGGLNCQDQINVVVDPSPDTAPPSNSCGTFSQMYDACPNLIVPNIPSGLWFAVGGDLAFTSTVNGQFPQLVNLNGCVSDAFTPLSEIELNLVTSTEFGVCPKTIRNEYRMRDECGNVSVDRIIVEHVFSEDDPPVWVFACEEDLVFTTEGGNVCPADADISLNPGDEFSIFDTWSVGGVNVGNLNGCVSDACTPPGLLIIRVDDIDITGDDCERVITLTLVAEDECGNVSLQFVNTYTFIDDTPPVVNYLGFPDGTTLTVECDLRDPSWDPFVPTEDLTIFDNCADFADLTITMEDELVAEGECGVDDFKSIWRCTWTVSDPCDNTTEYTLFTRIVDTQGPEWTFFPPDESIECDEDVPFQQATAEDLCSEVEVFYQDDIIPGDCPHNYTIRREWTAVDGCGNPTTDDQFIEVSDTTPPDILFIDEYISAYEDGQEVYVDCGQFSTITKLRYATRAFDNCSGETAVEFEYEDFGLFDCAEFGYMGHLVTRWTSTDECGNTRTAILYWFLTDTTPPRLQGVPEDDCVSTLPPVPNVTAVDDCEFAVVEFSETLPIDCAGGQYVERTWTGTDVCGNSTSATQRLYLSDGDGPTVSVNTPGLEGLPSGSTGQISADCPEGESIVDEAALLASIGINDGCSTIEPAINLILLDEGDCTTTGYLARYHLEVSATDICGNTTNYELFIEIVDNTPPTFNMPTDVIFECDSVIFDVDVTDDCSSPVEVFFDDTIPLEISCPDSPVAQEVIWTATDACGNSSTFVQNVTVLDKAGPELRNVPADACNDTSLDEPVTAFDECSGTEVPVNLSETTEIVAGCGEVLTRTWTATDACGNTTTATQQVFFTDDQAPILSFAHPLLADLNDGDELILPIDFDFGDPTEPFDFGAQAIAIDDNCAGNLEASLRIQHMPVEDCAAYGYLARLRYTWTVVDPCGNESKISIQVLYEDTYGPDIFGVPDDLTIYCDDPVPEIPDDVYAKDNYDEEVSVGFDQDIVNIPGAIRIIRTWTATDDCGNVTIETQFIDIIDNTLTCEFDIPDVVFCNSEDNLMSVIAGGGTPPYTYSWEMTDCDGFITSGATGPSILYTVGYTTQNFSVTITDANNCERVCTTSVVCEKDDAVLSFQNEDVGLTELQVYPNPADGQLILRSLAAAEKTGTIRMYSIFGQLVHEQRLSDWPAEDIRLDTRTYPAGTYVLRVEVEGMDPITREIVILH
ncbi:MAG: T9SS type A sorting domain-containing protein [Bacteroidota bacterium]